MTKLKWLYLVLLFASCDQFDKNSLHEQEANITKTYKTNDTIPERRRTVNPSPVASYMHIIEDDLNEWKFAVNIFETKQTFKYLVRLQYKEIRASDTLNIPNFGTNPKVEIIKGKDNYSCIIGFRNKKNEFKEYKSVSVKGNQLKISQVKSYFVGVYSTKTVEN